MGFKRGVERICAMLFVALSALFLASCGASQGEGSKFYDKPLYEPHYASGFEILTHEGCSSSLLRVTRPWQGDEAECFELLILRNGEQAPAGFSGSVLEGDAERIVALSSSNVAMFDALGKASTIVGVSGLDYISSLAIRERGEQGLTKDVGYDSNLNFELLLSLRPDVVLLYSVAGGNSTITAKLTQLGIPYLYIGDYAEESPLGKAEWLVAMGEICGQRTKAEEKFASCRERYESIAEQVAQSDIKNKPRVVLNTPYRDVWYLPHNDSYMVKLICDAGGDYFYDGNSSQQTQPISIELAYKLVSESDIWLNTGAMVNSIADLKRSIPKFADMPPVVNGAVYNSTARTTAMGGSDFYESGVVRPDMVLADLVEIMHPEILDHELYYYQKLE